MRALHAVGQFVPPAQELWYDAGGDPEQARQEVRERSTELTERVGGWLREQGLTVETTVRDGEAGPAVVEEAKEWGQTSSLWARAATPASGGCSKGASRSTW